MRIVNQGQGVIFKPDGTVKNLNLDNTLAERVPHIPLFSLLSEYQNSTINVAYQGTVDIGSTSSDVVAVSFVPATAAPSEVALYVARTQTLFFVDQKTSLVTKIQFINYAENDPNSEKKYEVYFAKYQSIDEIAAPFQITTYVDGQLQEQINLDTFAFNVGLPDTDFALSK